MQKVNHRLGPADRECRDDHLAASLGRPSHDLPQSVGGLVDWLVGVSAIGALADEQVARWNRLRIAEDRQFRPADIAREGQPSFPRRTVDADGDRRRSEQVAGVGERRLEPLAHRDPGAVPDRLEAVQGSKHVPGVEQGLDLRLVRTAFAVQVGGVLPLDLGRVPQHDRREGAGGRRAIDRAGESAADEVREVAAMIDVRVAEDHRIDVLGPEGKFPVAVEALRPPALEQPAVEQDRFPAGRQLVHRPRDRAHRAPERDRRGVVSLCGLGH